MSICFMTRWRPDRGSGVLDEAEEESSEKNDHDRREQNRKKNKNVCACGVVSSELGGLGGVGVWCCNSSWMKDQKH